MFWRAAAVFLVAAILGGCAFTQADLDVGFDPEAARSGPISSAPPQSFDLAEFEDVRIDRERIGYKKNSFGQNTADIKTLKPVTQIVREAVQATLEKNGHQVATASPLRIEGEVTQFWFDTQMNFWTVEFMGTVECKLKVEDAATGAPVYDAAYTGHYNEKSGGGYEKSWRRVMNLAVANLVDSLAADEKLAAALRALSPQAAD